MTSGTGIGSFKGIRRILLRATIMSVGIIPLSLFNAALAEQSIYLKHDVIDRDKIILTVQSDKKNILRLKIPKDYFHVFSLPKTEEVISVPFVLLALSSSDLESPVFSLDQTTDTPVLIWFHTNFMGDYWRIWESVRSDSIAISSIAESYSSPMLIKLDTREMKRRRMLRPSPIAIRQADWERDYSPDVFVLRQPEKSSFHDLYIQCESPSKPNAQACFFIARYSGVMLLATFIRNRLNKWDEFDRALSRLVVSWKIN